MPERCGWRGASSAKGGRLRARCGDLGGAGHLGHGGGGSGTTDPSVQVAQGDAVKQGAARERGGDTVQGRHGDATPRPLADRGAQDQELGRLQRSSSIPIESTMPRCAMRSRTLW